MTGSAKSSPPYEGNNILDSASILPYSLRDLKPHSIVSLLDMKELSRGSYEHLTVSAFSLISIDDNLGWMDKPKDQQIDQDNRSKLKQNLLRIGKIVAYMNLESALKYIERVFKKLKPSEAYTFGAFEADAEVINNLIDDALEEIKFGFIPKKKVEYWQQKKLFGGDVYDQFPSARDEITEAGNCFAHDLNTACIFHLMRAVEIGVHAMHWSMTGRVNLTYEKYKPSKGATRKSKPIELCDWQQLYNGLTLALETLERGKSTSKAKHDKHTFYSELIGIFKHFKDAWRNTISHGHEIDRETKRLLFEPGETEDIMRFTRKYFEKLAKRVAEKGVIIEKTS